MKRKILLVDDHPIVRSGLREMIERESDLSVCGEAEDATQALRALDELEPDMAIVDISLRGTSGIDLIKQFHSIRKGLPILVISMHAEDLYAERALRAGAKGYIQKQQSPKDMREAIRRVLNGRIYVSGDLATKLLEKSVGGGEEYESSPVERLSDRELEVYRLIGQGMKPKQIADELSLSVKTIENYRVHIREKLHIKDAAELSRHAIEWRLQEGDSHA